MPGTLLHIGATVNCAHQGQAQPTSVDPRVKVMGNPVVTQASTYAFTLVQIPNPLTI
ncbi:hypothetical protein [Anabaena sp. UHCC 0399]|uniref:hypothetical protein n=1 Tax=Anabaena sp. UHCC 0399 TaxID=3110238 RepID=UPI002B1EC7BF|nr:hypothetical protein [Anabaena sp. UHCC 0399]MEA5567772.1 hypothetical protein [Anabaena sp. UHCC 0399]